MSPQEQQPLFEFAGGKRRPHRIHRELRDFDAMGTRTHEGVTQVAMPGGGALLVPTYTGEFWTSKQRLAHRLHEVSYRACFKPQLPRFFIERLTKKGDVVHDPFMGRGTTPLEAALLGRTPAGSDANPLSEVLLAPRLQPPTQEEVEAQLEAWAPALAAAAAAASDDSAGGASSAAGEPSVTVSDGTVSEGAVSDGTVSESDLLAFYHPQTLAELCTLRGLLHSAAQRGPLEPAAAWIRMVAVNRLTGHSPGFFSVYTLPPNQATSPDAQRRINHKRDQTPPRRHVLELIARKSATLLKGIAAKDRKTLARRADGLPAGPLLGTAPADATAHLDDASVALVVTSPPFLDVVHYKNDNWLRCWFCGIDPDAVDLTMARTVPAWQEAMTAALRELHRVVRPGGFVAFEVGEVRGGSIRLEEAVLPCGVAAGFDPELVLVHVQDFTKTANCWGVDNNTRGTNTNRVVLFARR